MKAISLKMVPSRMLQKVSPAVDQAADFLDQADDFVRKASPWFICFAAGFFTGVIVNMLQHM